MTSVAQDSQKVKLLHIGWAYGSTDIALVKAAFLGANLPVFIFDAEVHNLLPHQGVAMGGARIYVLHKDKNIAREVLATCVCPPQPGARPILIAFLLFLTLFWGVPPLPYRAIFLRDDTQETVLNVL